MPFIPVPNVAQIELVFDYNGQVVENVYNVDFGVPVTSALMATCCGSFKDWWNVNMKPLVATNVVLSAIRATDMSAQNGPVVNYVTGIPLSGSVTATNPMPNNVTVAVKWTTNSRGRSFRGRTYHVGMLASNVAANQLVAGTRSALTTAYFTLIASVLPGTAHLVVVSRRSNNQWRTTGISTTIVAAIIDGNLDSMRNRLAGRGS